MVVGSVTGAKDRGHASIIRSLSDSFSVSLGTSGVSGVGCEGYLMQKKEELSQHKLGLTCKYQCIIGQDDQIEAGQLKKSSSLTFTHTLIHRTSSSLRKQELLPKKR